MIQKRKLGKRIAAWFMCLAMVLSIVNLPGFAMTAHAAAYPTTITGKVGVPMDEVVYCVGVDETSTGKAEIISGKMPDGLRYEIDDYDGAVRFVGTPKESGTFYVDFYTEEFDGGRLYQGGFERTIVIMAANASTAQAPSVTAFATKAELVDKTKFTLWKADGGVAQKVNFGNEKTWYISGSQKNGTELVLLCDPENPIRSQYAFKYDNINIYPYEPSMGTYEGSATPTNVSSSHYGASDIREWLTKCYGDGKVDMFSSAEQALMKNTKVYTEDIPNGRTVYSTSDKLYLAYGQFKGNFITVGANKNSATGLNSGIQVGLKEDNGSNGSPYTKSNGIFFWIRTSGGSDVALVPFTGGYVNAFEVSMSYPVVPAFNMDMSKVLFASVAKAASSNAILSDAMTFRMDGTDKVKSSAVACAGNIYITKGTSGNEYLYVQGKDRDNDWVYSEKITANATISAEGIRSAKKLLDIDLTKCKIWIETTYDNVTYAKEIVVSKNHDYVDQGDGKHKCSICGNTENHDFSKCVSNGDGTHKVMCTVCDTVKEGHDKDTCSGGTATCTKKAKCDKCGKGYGKLAEHTLKTTTTKATLTADGKKETKCTVCGKVTKTTKIYAAKTVKLSKTTYTYDGKAKKPTVTIKDSKGKAIATSNYTVKYDDGRKNVGKYNVKITFKGDYKGSKTLTFTINPKATTLKSVTPASKAFTATWTKQTTQVDGYELEYALDKNFTSGAKKVAVTKNTTTSKKISSLKSKKTYYVRVRTYKKVGTKKYYSDWSKVLNVKTK